MKLSQLTAISPVDGRYGNKTNNLSIYFSECALIRYRVRIEIEYFIALTEYLPQLSALDTENIKTSLRKLYLNFTEKDAARIKEIESVTNHDVKAVEYFIKERTTDLLDSRYHEFIHFGLTSQDINNTAIPLSIKEALNDVYVPLMLSLIKKLKSFAADWKDIPMLARTHGQPATPTRLGKELMVFASRLDIQLNQLRVIPLSAKFGGATGNFNAHHVAYPEYDWKVFADQFVSEVLGLEREQWTTQISNYDNMAALFDAMARINVIIMDFCKDMWQYISMDYFKQKIKAGEVGSSAMPHKVNPIDYENAEGNLGIANALLIHMANKLPISRLQRDLTDSTVLRNVGVPMGHIEIALKSLDKGLSKLLLHEVTIKNDLDNCWAVVAEAIQTILRREGYDKPYEALKALTRGHEGLTKASISNFIDSLDVKDEVKIELKKITPSNYTGI